MSYIGMNGWMYILSIWYVLLKMPLAYIKAVVVRYEHLKQLGFLHAMVVCKNCGCRYRVVPVRIVCPKCKVTEQRLV